MAAVKARVQIHNGYATFRVLKDDEAAEFFSKIRVLQDTEFNERTFKEQKRIMLRRKYGNQANARPLSDQHAWGKYTV